VRYDRALHCHATIEMMNLLMHTSFCLSNEACVIMWVLALLSQPYLLNRGSVFISRSTIDDVL